MTHERLIRSIEEPIRHLDSWADAWKGADCGLIKCWERGREMQRERPDLRDAALRGELPTLPWRGGIEGEPKMTKKVGSMNYLAMWQGLFGMNLDVPLDGDESLACTRTGIVVTFTTDISRFNGW